ncbi:MAG TPA: glycosyltransferase 87 family protein, partial [Pseudonocardiaceae bacterium]|nr:glycosyltransferase 87 family protein [Pseudonocardiaceae bacterium]
MLRSACAAPVAVRARYGDVAVYLACTAFAVATLAVAPFFDYRVWAAIALPGYLFGLVQSSAVVSYGTDGGRWLTSRQAPIAVITLLSMVIPLCVLVITRVHRAPWSEQPEVWVVERSTQLLLRHGTPYTDLATLGRPPVVNDYTPYGPAMTVFGLPRALFGVSPLTDARVAFAVCAVLAVAAALWLTGSPHLPIRALQFVVACPLAALSVAVAGDDVAIIGLLLLALALLHRARPAWCAAIVTVAVSVKLTAVPALIVIGIAVLAMLGRRAFGRFALTVLGLGAVLNVPVLLVDPGSVVEHVIRFPIGLGKA